MKWINNWLIDISQEVVVSGKFSSKVLQGNVLRPVVLNIFISVLESLLITVVAQQRWAEW